MNNIIDSIHYTLVAITLVIGVIIGFVFSLGFLIDAFSHNRLSTFGISLGVSWLTWALTRGFKAFVNQDKDRS